MSSGDEIQVVTFEIGGQEFGFNVFDVERVLRYARPTPLPESPDYLEGTVKFGNDAIPVVDLRKRLGVTARIGDETRIIVLELDRGRVGLVVDAVLEVMKVPADLVRPPSPLVQGLAAEYITGIIAMEQRSLILLTASRLLDSKEILTLSAFTAELTDE